MKLKHNMPKALMLGTAPLLAFSACTSKAPEKPNIIFLLFDDAGYGDIGCYGQTKTETPVIDALASQGILFTDMYTAAPLSSPSRACLMTGQHMGHSQIRANVEVDGGSENIWDYEMCMINPLLQGQYGLAEGTPTLGTMMQSAGYKTAVVGKWGIGAAGTITSASRFGFDLASGVMCQRWAHMYYPPAMWKNDELIPIPENPLVKPGTNLDPGADPLDPRSYDKYVGGSYGPDLMFDDIKEFIGENKDNPFMLLWTTNVPHSPVQCPPEGVGHYLDKYGDEEPLEVNGHVDTWPHNYYPCRYPHATYSSMITHIDTQLGELCEYLKKLGIYDNTIIIISSDNGPAVNASSLTSTLYFDSAAPFPSRKGWTKSSLHEGGIRVPFVVSWPAKIKKGFKTDFIGFFPDLMPTFAELSGAECPATDGISLAEIFSGNAKGQAQHEYLYFEFPGSKGWVAVRYGQWKGLLRKASEGNTKMELYNIVEDPRETTDLAAEHPDIVSKMWQFVRESHTDIAQPEFQTSITFPSGI